MQVPLPIMVTLVATMWISSWYQNKRLDDLRDYMNHRFEEISRRFDDVNTRLERIERKPDNHEEPRPSGRADLARGQTH